MSKDLISNQAQSPVTYRKRIRPGALALMGVAGIALVVSHVWISLGLFFVGGIWFLAGWVKPKLETLSEASSQTDSIEEIEFKSVRQELTRLSFSDNAPSVCEKGVEKITLLRERYKVFSRLLDSKLNPNEMTYSRFQAIAQQVYLGSLKEGRKIVGFVQSVISISDQEKELARKNMRIEQLQKSEKILADLDHAITELDRVNVSLTQLKNLDGKASIDLDLSLKELQSIADRMHKYS